ncbi:MAG TPA: site-2 protease family protein [Gemmataceae bacterium]|nr:site-2 protease family protein [Gemmataceae bacterium]
MFALEPERTQFDLNWRMFGIPVRVHPMFWLIAALLGWPVAQQGLSFLLIWIGCVFVSILIHELGHVFAGRIFGAYGHIVLYSFGGLAIGSSNLPQRWQRVIVSFAGPLAGFILFGLILAAVLLSLPEDHPPLVVRFPWGWLWSLARQMVEAGWNPLLVEAVLYLLEINLFWGLLNLLPIWPLDGGKISRELLEYIIPSRGTLVALGLSGTLAALLAINSLAAHFRRPFLPDFIPAGGLYSAFFFGMLALASFQLYQAEADRRKRWESDEATPWEREHGDWNQEDRERDYWAR